MHMTNENQGDKITTLEKTVKTAIEFIQEGYKTSAINSSNSSKINVLELAHDAASLIRAHSIKLWLLIGNEPFTPSAVSNVLSELITSLIPSLLYALEQCDPKEYSQTMRTEIDFRVTELFAGMKCLIAAIPLNRQEHGDKSQNSDDEKRKRNLTTAGTILQSCDALIGLKKDLIAGLLSKRAVEYRNLLKDALDELIEWADEESDEDDENEAKDIEEPSPQLKVDLMFSSMKHIPPNDANGIRPRLQASTKRLRLMTHMFQAVVKRRFKTLPTLPYFQREKRSNYIVKDNEIIKTLDHVLEMMKSISNLTDELAYSFYVLDVQQIDLNMDKCFSTGVEIAEILKKNWEGQQDNFSVWLSKFQKELLIEKTA